MPFKSQAQAAYLLGSNSPLSVTEKVEWKRKTKGRRLPKRARKPKSKKG